MLVEAFRIHWPNAWPDMQSALKEVEEAIQPGKIARAAVDETELSLVGSVRSVSIMVCLGTSSSCGAA